MRKNLKIKRGSAQYECAFEQGTAGGCVFKTFIAVPKQFECDNIRLHNALMFAQYKLQREILRDNDIFGKCYRSRSGWEYEQDDYYTQCEDDAG